jgi:hypothetical protein
MLHDPCPQLHNVILLLLVFTFSHTNYSGIEASDSDNFPVLFLKIPWYGINLLLYIRQEIPADLLPSDKGLTTCRSLISRIHSSPDKSKMDSFDESERC